MEARSTNTLGFVHYGGDVVAGVNDGIAVHLRSASTGAAAIIEPLSDSDTAALTVRAKGTAALTLGNSSNTVAFAGSQFALNSTNVAIGTGSTTFFTLVQKYTVEVAPPALNASTGANSSYTVTGLTTNSVIVASPRMPLNVAYTYRARCSTANELIINWLNVSASTQSDSTNRMTVLAFNFV